MSIHQRVQELQNLFDENELLIENNCARLSQLQQELSQEEVSFLEVKDKLIKLLQQLKVSYGSTQPYTTYLQEIADAANALNVTSDFNTQLANVLKSFQ